MLLFKETYILLFISTMLAIPSYFIVNNWMNNFAYRIDFGGMTFGLTLLTVAVSTLILAAATISQEAIRAARSNPSVALKQ